jgi:hypothetical protein
MAKFKKTNFPHAVNTQYLVAAIGKSCATVTRMKIDGCPCLPDGRWDLPQVIGWIEQQAKGNRSDSPVAQKTMAEVEKLHLEIEKRELELKRMNDESITRQDHEMALTERAKYVRQVIDYETGNYAPEIVGTDSLAGAIIRMKALAGQIIARLRGKDAKK